MIRAEFRGIVTGLGLVGALVLAGVSVDLSLPGQDLLGSIRFHLAFAMLALAACLVLSGARLRAVMLTALIFASIGQGALVVWHQQELRLALVDRPAIAEFKLLSFNVLSQNPTPDDAAQAIVDSGADVAVIMEAPGVQGQLPLIGQTYPYRIGCDSPYICDIMLLSRTPLIDAKIYPLPPLQRMRLVVAKTVIDGQMVTVVGVHLTKPYFDEASWVEVSHLYYVLTGIEGPVVFAGDFNAAAWSRTINDLATRAQLIPPPRYPSTWPVRAGDFGVPIDNMFTRGPALIDEINAVPAHGSNHRGLLARIGVRQP